MDNLPLAMRVLFRLILYWKRKRLRLANSEDTGYSAGLYVIFLILAPVRGFMRQCKSFSSFVGANAALTRGCLLATWAGAVVIKDVPDNVAVVGAGQIAFLLTNLIFLTFQRKNLYLRVFT